jgi:hypothetical protein
VDVLCRQRGPRRAAAGADCQSTVPANNLMTSRITYALLACALGMSLVVYAELSLQECQFEQNRISTEYKSALKDCARRNGHARTSCVRDVQAALPVPKRNSPCSSGHLSLLSFR